MRRRLIPSSKIKTSHPLFAFDLISAFLAPLAALWIANPTGFSGHPLLYLLYAFLSTTAAVPIFVHFGVGQGLARFFSYYDALQIAKAAAVSIAVTLTLVFTFTQSDYLTRPVPVLQFSFLAASLIVARLPRRMLTYRDELGALSKVLHDQEGHIIIVGSGRAAWLYMRLLYALSAGNLKTVALLDQDDSLHGRAIDGHLILGGPDDAPALLDDFAQHGISVIGLVICDCDPVRAAKLFERLQPLCQERGIAIELATEQIGVSKHLLGSDARDDIPNDFWPSDYFRLKQPVESAIAAVLLAALAPLCAIVATAVGMTMGYPIVFWQRRVGKDGTPIYVYKFKTMRNPLGADGRLLSNDERHSRVGRFLRATRLDELPQLYNIAKGEMALIGPRPLLPVDQPAGKTIRLKVRPGLSGWAQIHGGQLITVDQKNALDEWYVRNACLRLDLIIAMRTFITAFTGDRLHDEPTAVAFANARPACGALSQGVKRLRRWLDQLHIHKDSIQRLGERRPRAPRKKMSVH
jgi:lipopolysaccharide/colanic/teichoic acid biosynthesis glycosyltransferase